MPAPTPLLPRGIMPRIHALLEAVPVVVVEGARACGKSALGEQLSAAGAIATTVDLGDPTTLRAASASPATFVDGLQTPAFIDEAQLVPDLTLAVKRRADRDRRPGSFILTGSSRLGRDQLGGSDPLAGRAARLTIRPMTQGELAGRPTNLVSRLIDTAAVGLDAAAVRSTHGPTSRSDLLERIRRGGLPTIAGVVGAVPETMRPYLVAEYIEGVLLHETGKRTDRAETARLLRYLTASTARLLNVSTISNELATGRETVQARLASLEACFLLHRLDAHRPAEHRVLTSHPKIHAMDCSIAAWASRLDETPSATLLGGLVETFVINELAAQASWCAAPPALRHWRDTARKLEVDAVLIVESGESIAIEVKAATDVRPDDLKGLKHYLASVHRAVSGIIFYTGELALRLDERIWALPIAALWADASVSAG